MIIDMTITHHYSVVKLYVLSKLPTVQLMCLSYCTLYVVVCYIMCILV